MNHVANGDFTIQLETESCINEIQDSYRSFNTMVRELGVTETLQTDFVSGVSHEFKTPLGAIEGYAILLQSGDVSRSDHDLYVNKILLNTRRLSELVSNILLFSRIDNQVMQRNEIRYRLDEQIRQSIVVLEPKWSAKDIKFDVDLERVEYQENEAMLLHVWNNLIDNAIKFVSLGGSVEINMLESDHHIRITVADNGPGIDEESIQHIFDKFYQTDESHKTEGNGLGLAIVKQVISFCGDTVTAANRASGGTVFTVELVNPKSES